MESKLICNYLSVHTTTVCTLRCAKCAMRIPMIKSPVLADLDKTLAALSRVFEVYDYVTELRFAGAEAFLYPQIETMMKAASQYRDRFHHAIIATNGTYIPKDSIIETMKQLPYPLLIRIDNYGVVSGEADELMKRLISSGIKAEIRTYTGENQAFGGWVDFGDCADRHYTEEELRSVFDRCRYPDNGTYLINDKLTSCCHATMCYLTGEVSVTQHPRDVIDLFSESIEEIRKRVRAWRDEPFEVCRYCNGFDPENGTRIPAGEQLP